MANEMKIHEGDLVRHPTKPEWGLGKVLAMCPSSNKWNRGSDFLVESFVPHFQFTRRVVGSANGVSRWSFS